MAGLSGTWTERGMKTRSTLAIAVLVVSAVYGLGIAVSMLTSNKDAPPLPIPVLIIICAAASAVAAIGLSRRATWAIPTGIGFRAVDGLLALIGLFASATPWQKGNAALDVVLSVVAIVVLSLLRTAKQR